MQPLRGLVFCSLFWSGTLFAQPAAPAKPIAPSECQLVGRIENRGADAVVRIQVQFRFKTVQPQTILSLGLQKAQLLEAKFDDGRLPLLSSQDGAIQVQVDKPDVYSLRIELEVPLISRGNKPVETGFDLGLPGAAITTLALQVPDGVKRINLVRKETSLSETRRLDVTAIAPGREPYALGAATNLEVSWEVPKVVETIAEPRSVTSDISINILETEVVSEAKIKLRGPAKEWRIVAPITAEMLVQAIPNSSDSTNPAAINFPVDQAPKIIRPEPDKPPIWKIQWNERMEQGILITILVRTPLNRPNDPKAKWLHAVTPFAVQEVPLQSGTIRVRTPSQLRVFGNPKGDTRRLESADDSLLYRYGILPNGNQGLPGTPLELELRPLPSAVQTRMNHQLQRVDRGWRIRTDLQITPIRAEVDQLEIDVPQIPDFQNLVVLPPEFVESVQPIRENGGRRYLQVRLAQPKREPFQIAIEGFYPVSFNATQTSFGLPRVATNFDRGGNLEIQWGDERELRGGLRELDSNNRDYWVQPIQAGSNNGYNATFARSPAIVELDWSRPKPLLKLQSQIDCTSNGDQAVLLQKLQYRFVDRTTRQWTVKIAADAIEPRSIQVSDGVLQPNGVNEWTWTFPATIAKEGKLQIQSVVSLREGTNRLPIFEISEAVSHDRSIRCWNEPQTKKPWNFQLFPQSSDWWAEPIQFIEDRPILPAMVAKSFLPTASLDIVCTPKWVYADGREERLWVERGLVQWHRGESVDRYRFRYWLRPRGQRQMEFVLPTNFLEAEVYLENRLCTVAADGNCRIDLPEKTDGTGLLLEVRYQVPTTIEDYYPRGQVIRFREGYISGPIRWAISQSTSRLMLYVGSNGRAEEELSLRNGSPAWLPSYTNNELEAWFQTGAILTEIPSEWNIPSDLLLRQVTFDGPRLLIIGPILLVLSCSLTVFFCGFIILFLPWRGGVAILLVLLTFNAILAFRCLNLFHWTWLASLPGLLLILILSFGYQLMIWRYRQRLNYVPTFSRAKADSAQRRIPGSKNRIAREISTTDAPAAEPWAGS